MYAIDVVWNGQSWTVYRRYKQFNDFSAQAKKASFTFASALPGKKIQGNLKDHFVEQRQVPSRPPRKCSTTLGAVHWS